MRTEDADRKIKNADIAASLDCFLEQNPDAHHKDNKDTTSTLQIYSHADAVRNYVVATKQRTWVDAYNLAAIFFAIEERF